MKLVPLFGRMLACSFLWASAFLLMKLIGTDISPLALTAVRGLIGGGVLAFGLLAMRQGVVPRGREWRDWFMLGLFQGIIPNTLTAYALTEIGAGLSSMIQASTPLLVAAMAHSFFADEKLTPRRGVGVLIGFAGMAVLLGPDAFSDNPGSSWGILAMLVTALSYAVGILYVRSIPTAQPLRLAFGQQICSGLPTFVAVLAIYGPGAFSPVGEHAIAVLALGVFATAVPIVIFMNILRTAGPTLGSMNGYLVPIWTILMGISFLNETVGLREIAGGIIVLAGVFIVSRARRPRAR
jgi:drug/metabolite transporter (DMT)-like permease